MDTPIFDCNGVIGVGYEGLDANGFIEKVQAEQVSLLVDVRLNPISRKPGLSKTKLSANLKSISVDYLHAPALGNPKWNRSGFAGTVAELQDSRSTYSDMLVSPEAIEWIKRIAKEGADRTVALMCFEANEERCHRYVTLQAIRRQMSLLALT
ncbi:DUF488 domain-containing protein [Nocardiopsis quinghaiensis]|uniref:DUF488 domain-containing protein n=1 Tax=Nocardiopsis quinghaiensis TaxID=464995 RepID=UPI001238C966|nr:DUF488 domain-containing protein [Nocardiopsis quinghaiensis]